MQLHLGAASVALGVVPALTSAPRQGVRDPAGPSHPGSPTPALKYSHSAQTNQKKQLVKSQADTKQAHGHLP